MSAKCYILGDADRVREKIEAALFSGDLSRLRQISEALTQAVTALVARMAERLQAEMIMAGGDDVFFTANANGLDIGVIEVIAQEFSKESGCTISFGVGVSPEDAYLQLRRAKASGGGTISIGARL